MVLDSFGEIYEEVEKIFKFDSILPQFQNINDEISICDFGSLGNSNRFIIDLFQTIAFKKVIKTCKKIKFIFLF